MPTLRDSNKAIIAYEDFLRCTVTIILQNQSSFLHGENLMKSSKSTQRCHVPLHIHFHYPREYPTLQKNIKY